MYADTFITVSLLLAGFGSMYCVDLPNPCNEEAYCADYFKENPLTKIVQCNQYMVLQACCQSCKSLIDVLNTEPVANCPWGNKGYGISTDFETKTCQDITEADCTSYCLKDTVFQINCCQSCFNVCNST